MILWHVVASMACMLFSLRLVLGTEQTKTALNSTHCACESVHGILVTCFGNYSKSCVKDETKWNNERCQKYASCKTCAKGLNRCLTCPPNMYGQWCEKECLCVNDGACGPNGTCICQNGFTGLNCEHISPKILKKSLTIMHNGKRSIIRQTSSVQCPVLPPPQNGHVHLEFDNTTVGDAVKYTCKENYTMMGSRTRHCLPSGMWSGEAPTCEKMCPFPPISEHVNVKINPHRIGSPLYDTFQNEVLAELEFGCTPGYNLVGALRLRCASGIWDQEVPICKQDISCLDPGIPKRGNRTSTVQSSGTYRIGSQLIYYCNPQHRLIGSQSLICMPSGNWNASLPFCIPNLIAECTFNCKVPWDASQTVFQEMDKTLQCTSICEKEIQDDKKYIILTP